MKIERKLRLLRAVSSAFLVLSTFLTAYMVILFVQTGSALSLVAALLNGLAVYMNINSIRGINEVLKPIPVPITARDIVRRD